MRAALVIALLASGCGRFGFDPFGSGDDAGNGSARPDVAIDSGPADGAIVVFPMDNDAPLQSMLVAMPPLYSTPCPDGCPTSVPGKFGNAYEFTAGPVVFVAHPELVSTSAEFSVGFWFNVTDMSGDLMPMFAKAVDPVNSTNDVLSMWVGFGGQAAGESSLTDGTQTATGTVGVDARDGMWHHVAFTYDGNNGHYFYDGLEQGALTGPLGNSQEPLTIGGDIDPTITLEYTGKLDDLRFYDRALGMAELQMIVTQ